MVCEAVEQGDCMVQIAVIDWPRQSFFKVVLSAVVGNVLLILHTLECKN